LALRKTFKKKDNKIMKKLILIFSLLLSSINVSADLNDNLNDRIADYDVEGLDDFLISSSSSQERQDQAQESFDTYETFLEFNDQQEQNNPTGSRVSDSLMSDAKIMAMYDLIAFAVSSTFQGILTRNPDADYNYEVTSSDIEEGINASREIIGSFRDNPVFSAFDQLNMAASVNYYFNVGFNSNDITRGPSAMSEQAFRNILFFKDSSFSLAHGADTRLPAANRFSSNFLSTFFTNQNAVQSTCLGGGSCASPVGGM
jgi:hypothetical protein